MATKLVRPTAFGNALGEAIAEAASSNGYRGQGSAASPYVDPDTGEHVVFGKPYQSDPAQVRQFVGAFGDGSMPPVDRSNDVLLAAGLGYSGPGVDPGSMESLRGADGVYRLKISGTSVSPVSHGPGGEGASDGVVELSPVVITGHRMTDAEKAAYDAQLFQETNDARVAAGTYDRFGEVGSALSDGRYRDFWRHLAFDASGSAKISAAARTYQPPSLAAQRLDLMLTSPVGTTASLAVRALGGNQTWQDAALIGGSFGENAIGGAFGLPRTMAPAQSVFASPPRGRPGDSYRAYLDQKFGRTGDLNFDINARGAADIQHGIDRLAREGHAPGRHGPRVTETALDNRVLFKFDPITGTTTDYYSRGTHSVGRNATQILSNPAMLRAEAYVRGTPEFAGARADAELFGRDRFAVKGLPLPQALGPGYLDDVFGKARVGSVNNPAGTVPIDFTNGTLTSVFRRGSGSYWNLYTMYPEPKP